MTNGTTDPGVDCFDQQFWFGRFGFRKVWFGCIFCIVCIVCILCILCIVCIVCIFRSIHSIFNKVVSESVSE